MQCRRHGLRQTWPPAVALQPCPGHAGITRSPFRGFPLWHPLWMGRIEWFRRWRYEETAWLAQDQELLLRSYRLSRFANLPQVLLGYRRERVTLKKLLRYKLLHIQYVCSNRTPWPAAGRSCSSWLFPAARFAANCVALLGGFEQPHGSSGRRSAHRGGAGGVAQPLDICSPPGMGGRSSETFLPSSLLQRAKDKQGHAHEDCSCAHAGRRSRRSRRAMCASFRLSCAALAMTLP